MLVTTSIGLKHGMDVLQPVWRINVNIEERGAPRTCTNTVCTIDQNKWDHWEIPLGLNRQTVVLLRLQQWIVGGMEQSARERCRFGENVTS